jgi:hypothetical protein
MSMFTPPPAPELFSFVTLALGCMFVLWYTRYCIRLNQRHDPPATPAPSVAPSTELPAPHVETDTTNPPGTLIYPVANAPQGANPYPSMAAFHNPVPGTYGRWCERCQSWKSFAVLERWGDNANTVDYVPRCATCNAVLLPVRPDELTNPTRWN